MLIRAIDIHDIHKPTIVASTGEGYLSAIRRPCGSSVKRIVIGQPDRGPCGIAVNVNGDGIYFKSQGDIPGDIWKIARSSESNSGAIGRPCGILFEFR